MVYESDFYTTRRPYRASPSLSTYTITSEPSRQIRILPGLGKVHVVHSYDRIVPYVGHKRLTVVTAPPVVVRVRPSVLYREYDRIENKYRPFTYNSYTNDYLNSDSSVRIVYTRNPISGSYYYTDYYRPKGSTTATTTYTYRWPPVPRLYSYLNYPYYYPYTFSYSPFWPTTRLYSQYSGYRPSHFYYDYLADSFLYPSKYYRFSRMFDDETRLIRAQSAALLKRVSCPVPRAYRAMPLPYISSRYDDYPVRWTNDNYINKMLIASPTSNYKSDYTTYSTEPVRKYFGQGHLAAVTLVGDRAQPRRRNVYVYVEPENRHHPVMKDIELMSYYINRMKQERALKQKSMASIVVLDPARPSRIFSVPKPLEDPAISGEIAELRQQRAARLARILDVNEEPAPVAAGKKKRDPAEEDKRKAEEKRAKLEEAARKEKQAQAKKEEAARKAELARQEELAARAAAGKAAEAERVAELARQEEIAKQAEIEKARAAEAERSRLEEEKRLADQVKAEEERQQLLRLEEIARQAEEEKEAELARQAEELAELARQEAELAEQAKREAEAAEEARKIAEAEELAKKQAELEELERKEKELEGLAKAEAELAEQARLGAEAAQVEAQAAEEDAAAAEQAEASPAEVIAPEEVPAESIAEPIAEADNNAEAPDDQTEIPADVESPAAEE